MKRIILLTLSIAVFIASCKKDSPACKTDAASISGSYKIAAVTYKASSSSAEVDYINILFDPCEKDNLYTFQSNGTYQIKDVGSVCTPTSDDNGTWSVSGNSMVVDGDPTAIESFDCKTLVISNSDTQVPGDKLKITLTRQ